MSTTIYYISNILIIICLASSLLQTRYLFNINKFNNLSVSFLATIQLFSILIAFGLLIYLFLISDFSFELVYLNSHSEKPLIYKLSGVWGNHEGSMLLWILILVLFNFFFSIFSFKRKIFQNLTVSVQSLMIFGFTLFILFLSNPFKLSENNYADGIGLNPILQDPLLAIHPPVLYLGYVGFSLVFSFAIAGLICKEIDKTWASIIKPWVFIAWSFLTAGIALGSFWAYYELGWGGYWFWDPVENASLMPWLAATALIHCVVVLEKKNTMQSWTIVLAIMTFSLSLIGTFLVRSGILNSVHTFASDPGRGLFILIFLFTVLFGSFFLFAIQSEKINKPDLSSLVSRSTGIQINNWLLMTILSVVFIGTMYPLATDPFLNQSLTVGPQYYAITITPLIIIFIFFMIFSPRLGWKESKLINLIMSMRFILISVLSLSFIISLYFDLFNLSEITIIFLSLILVFTSLKSGFRPSGKNTIIKSNLGQNIAHAGFGIFMIAVVSNAVYSKEKIYDAKVGDSLELSGYIFNFKKIEQVEGANFNSLKAYIDLEKEEKILDEFTPEIRFYSDPPTITSETSIIHKFFSDIYVVMNVPQNQQSVSVRLHIKPFMNILWFGVIMIILGGLITAFLKRTRIDEV